MNHSVLLLVGADNWHQRPFPIVLALSFFHLFGRDMLNHSNVHNSQRDCISQISFWLDTKTQEQQ